MPSSSASFKKQRQEKLVELFVLQLIRMNPYCSVILRKSGYFPCFLHKLRHASHSYTFSVHFYNSIIFVSHSRISHITYANHRNGSLIAYGLRRSASTYSYLRETFIATNHNQVKLFSTMTFFLISLLF
jgi:hypothetical protein